MNAVALGRVMQDGESTRTGVVALVEEHAAAMGRVAMALLGDAAAVEHVLEQVAREAATKRVAEADRTRAWLFGLLRGASAAQLSKLPLRTRAPASGTGPEASTRTELGRLRPTEREAVVLALVGGLDVAEVAVACNVDVATARARIGRGLQELATGGRS